MKRVLPMRGKSVFAFFLLLLCFAIDSIAQDMKYATIKNFIPPSPDVAAFAKYGDIPVSYSTGIPDISIPLYEIKSRKLSLPLTISYHASGFRPDEIPSFVGLGWVLNSGGMISRTVVGRPDDVPGGYPDTTANAYRTRSSLQYATYSTSNDNFYYLNKWANTGNLDTQADLYNFNLPSVAGQFMYDTKGKLHYTPTDRKLKINRININTFSVTDDNGTIYTFNETETTRTADQSGLEPITCWYLTKMVTYDHTDSIIFHYRNAVEQHDIACSYTFNVHVDPSLEGPPGITPSVRQSIVDMYFKRKLLDSIIFSGGSVALEYLNDRQDLGHERISKLKIYNANGILRTVSFNQSYFAGPDKRLRLDGLSFKDAALNTVNNYTLGYDSSFDLPRYLQQSGPFTGFKAACTDYWGYYNGNTSTTTLPLDYTDAINTFVINANGSPLSYITNVYQNYAGNRNVNASLSQVGMLKKITYPTGGFTEFSYTNNCVSYTGNDKDLLGGLRIFAILNVDPITGKSKVKTYTYDSGIAMARVIPDNFYYRQTTLKRIQLSPILNYDFFRSDFNVVCSPVSSFGYYNGSTVLYNKVTEYEGFPGSNKGKTEYVYSFAADSLYGSDMSKNWNLSSDRSWSRGQLLSKKVFRNDSTQYTLLHQTINTYGDIGLESFPIGIISEPMLALFGTGISLEAYLEQQAINGASQPLLNYFDYQDLRMTNGTRALLKTEETEYSNGSQLTTKTFTYGGNNHLYPTIITTTGSKPNEVITEIKRYPLDKNLISGLSMAASSGIDGLTALNVLATPVEIETKLNNNTIQVNRTDYQSFGAQEKVYPSLISQKNGNNPLEPRILFDSYDNAGNAATLRYVNGSAVSYIWDYNKTVVTANVKNAADNEIAFTSFETNDGGGWQYPGTPVSGGFAGISAYNLNQGNIVRNGLNTSRNYVVSYWSQSGGANVNGTTGISKNTSNGWTRYEHIINAPASITVSGNVLIDELRLYPVDAQMTTFTHIPLIGVTATAAPNNTYNFYEYDAFGRLSVVRDLDRNILKQYDYSYQDQNAVSKKGNWQLVQSMQTYGLNQGEYIDADPSSPTYNSKAWITTGLLTNYTPPISSWIPTGQKTCEMVPVTGNTGYTLIEVIDKGTYSSNYGRTTWIKGSYDATTCPPPCNQEGQKMVNGVCQTGSKVFTNYRQYVLNGQTFCEATYHYNFTDGSRSIDYFVTTAGECPTDS